MMGFYVFKYSEQSIDPKLSDILNKPSFLPMNEVSEELKLKAGSYVVMCSLF
jgi:hypothetical protein